MTGSTWQEQPTPAGVGSARVSEIGDEVAVARALRHLADQLLETAAKDIEAVTGKEAHLLPG